MRFHESEVLQTCMSCSYFPRPLSPFSVFKCVKTKAQKKFTFSFMSHKITVWECKLWPRAVIDFLVLSIVSEYAKLSYKSLTTKILRNTKGFFHFVYFQTGELIRSFHGHTRSVSGLQVVGRVLVTSCLDKLIRCYDLTVRSFVVCCCRHLHLNILWY